MAQIKEYDSPNAPGGLRISNMAESAAESTASNAMQTGNRIKASYDSLASEARSTAGVVGSTVTAGYDKYIVQPELSQLTTLYAGATDDLTQKWNKIAATADANDASIKQKFMDEEFQPAMDKIADGATTGEGQKFAEDQSNAMLKHFNEKTSADMSSRAGEALKSNLEQTKNSYSNVVQSDPSSVDHSMASWKAAVHVQVAAAAANGFLTPAQAAAAEGSITEHGMQELAHAAILGTGLKDPAAAQKLVESGKFSKYIDPETAYNLVKTLSSAQRADITWQRNQKDRAEQDASDEKVDDLTKRLYGGEGKPPSVKEIAVDPTLSKADKKTMLVAARQEAERDPNIPIVDDPSSVQVLTKKLTSANGLTTLDLIKARSDGQITDATFTRLNGFRKELEAEPQATAQYKAAEKAVNDALTNALPGMNKDPNGQAAVSKFVSDFLPKYLAGYRGGNLPDNALDVKDPNSMISKAMAPYMRTTAQKMADFTAEMAGFGRSTVPATDKPARVIDGVIVPKPLEGIARLDVNKDHTKFRDPLTNKLYDLQGREVAP